MFRNSTAIEGSGEMQKPYVQRYSLAFELGLPVIILRENKMSWSNEQKELYGIESKYNNRKYYHFWQEGQMKWEDHFLPGDKIPIESQS